jgi:hypothetical protein
MRRIARLALLLSVCTTAALAQDTKPSPTPDPPRHERDAPAEEKVYREDEVDVKAKRKGDVGVQIRMAGGRDDIRFTRDCPPKGLRLWCSSYASPGKFQR